MELLNKEFIHISSLPAAAPVLFIRKPSESLYFCINYYAFNQIIKKNHYSLLLIKKTLVWINKATYFIKLNVIAVFHNIYIMKGNEWLTVFYMCYDFFEWLVTLFDIINIFSMF